MPGSHARPAIVVDTSVPALLIKIGDYPVHAGSVGVIRSLGALGVPVYAITEDRFTPAALSRYLAGHFMWHGRSDEQGLVEQLGSIGRSLGRRAVALTTDDAAAVLLAEHAEQLRPYLLLPAVAPDLPRRLAGKRGLYELCRAHDLPTPRTAFPAGPDDLRPLAEELGFPVVVKNTGAGLSQSGRVVPGTTIVPDRHDLADRFGGLADVSGLLLQEYLPFDGTNDWFVHSYCDADAVPVVSFVGRKAYAWPPARGITADARSADNAALRDLTAAFVKAIEYRGVNDLDWRYDPRDGRFKLVDFNPRVGAQFRFGVTSSGVDVVRALHLDLTGRPIPDDDQDFSRRLVVENVYLPARARHRLAGLPPPPPAPGGLRTYGAWREGSLRDPLPMLAMGARVTGQVLLAAGRRLSRRAAKLVTRMGGPPRPP